MNIAKLQRLQSRVADSSNSTGDINFGTLPSSLLDVFVPGYSLISSIVLQLIGVDIAIFVTAGLFLFTASTAGLYVWRRVSTVFMYLCTASVYIDEGDDIFTGLMEWMAVHSVSTHSRALKAVTRKGTSASSATDSTMADLERDDEVLDEAGIFNFGKWTAKIAPRYEPYYGRYRFWHRGRLFVFNRVRDRRADSSLLMSVSLGGPEREQYVKLTCMGRSTRPVKDLLHDVKVWTIEREKSLTVIRRPWPKDAMRFRRGGAWDRVSARPSRPMETVVLDGEQKERLIEDVNEYLHPSSARWYANRGIPYRRGYLFHGPPGTGKTSLSFALAGVFGLEIFVISLLEPNLNEGDLASLFNNLPRRCIVLLEDIDTAGLSRRDTEDGKEDDHEKPERQVEGRGGQQSEGGATAQTTTSHTQGDTTSNKVSQPASGSKDWGPDDLARALKSVTRSAAKSDEAANGGPNKTGVSLSGLLNAIDGVAAHEGRVLVMTTNHPEKLDSALIRPGRVDMQIAFGLATRQQIRELFVRMYSSRTGERTGTVEVERGATRPVAAINGDVVSESEKLGGGLAESSAILTAGEEPVIATLGVQNGASAELDGLATDFADLLPGEKFSPAEIQGFLLTRRKQPYRALQEVVSWRDSTLASKEKKTKVVGAH